LNPWIVDTQSTAGQSLRGPHGSIQYGFISVIYYIFIEFTVYASCWFFTIAVCVNKLYALIFLVLEIVIQV